MKLMKYEEWIEKSEQIKNEYKTLDKLIDDCDKVFGKYYGTIYLSVGKIYMVRPILLSDDEHVHLSRDSIIFKKLDKIWNKVDVNSMVDELVKILKDKISIEKLIKDALYDTDPDQLKEIFERVVIKKGKVREKEGCYKLLIGGKRGSPYQFMLRG